MIPDVIQVARRRGKSRPAPRGYMEHHVGRGLLEKAAKLGVDPEQFAVDRYRKMRERPDALIGYTGKVYLFSDNDLVRPAHATWRKWELDLYRSEGWARNKPSIWARDYRDDTCKVRGVFYRDWFDRWQGGGRCYRSPLEIVRKVGGGRAWPNSTYFGVERLTTPSGVSTPEQDASSAWLFVQKAWEHRWFDPALIAENSLPQAWYLGHSDVCPARRWARIRGGGLSEGGAWDPGSMVDWGLMGPLIVRTALETAPVQVGG